METIRKMVQVRDSNGKRQRMNIESIGYIASVIGFIAAILWIIL